MEKINITIINSANKRLIDCEVSIGFTFKQLIFRLLYEKFIEPDNSDFIMILKRDNHKYIIEDENRTLAELGVTSKSVIILCSEPLVEDCINFNNTSDLDLTIYHPFDGSYIQVELPDDMTSDEIIKSLIANKFIEERDDEELSSCGSDLGYALNIKGGATLCNSKTLKQSGVVSGDILMLNPITCAC
ncbi:MAG: hypothetical protein KGV46_02795 [Pasteurella sp.]|nr:hypothetical protein [Pasteurella sp.]